MRFTNQKEELANWDTFCARFRGLFVTPTSQMCDATQKIFFRAHHVGKDSRSYIVDLMAGSKRAGQEIAQTERLKRINRDIREDVSQLTITKSSSSVDAFMEICKISQNFRNTRARLTQVSLDSAFPLTPSKYVDNSSSPNYNA